MRSIIGLTCLICVPVQVAVGQTVVYDVRPANGASSPVEVGFGGTVEYEVVISVSDDGTSDGLLFFGFDLLTDLGIEQPTDQLAWDQLILDLFFDLLPPSFGEPDDDGQAGTDDDDDLVGFFGTQGFAFTGQPGVAQPGPQVIVRGVAQTDPGVEGTFTVTVIAILTQLIGEDTDGDNVADVVISDSEFTTTFGPGFQIEVLPDGDQDGVPDIDDVCPGFDDNADADGDNTPDGCDVCPGFDDNTDGDGDNTPDGCDDCTDTDGDGFGDPGFVANTCLEDGCPADPGKTAAGQCGCGNADTDTDGDGTADCVDGCATDANKTAAGLCGCGTADTDTDGDGLADCIDDDPDVPFVPPPVEEDGACGACGALGMVLFPLALIGYAVLLFSRRRIL